jgi:hypothetical protein
MYDTVSRRQWLKELSEKPRQTFITNFKSIKSLHTTIPPQKAARAPPLKKQGVGAFTRK